MAISYKVLGQSLPIPSTDTTLYTVPAATQAIVSSLTITNVGGSSSNVRVYVRVGGAAVSTSNAIIYDAAVAANSVAAFTLGITLAATDVITVRTSSATSVTFQLFGSEIS